MDKRKIKTPGVMRKEAEELLALVKDEGIWAESDGEKEELGKSLARDLERLPMVGFSYKELYVIMRFLVLLNTFQHSSQSAEMVHYVRNENEELLCDVLAAGIISELDDYAATNLFNALKGIEITIREVGTDDVQR